MGRGLCSSTEGDNMSDNYCSSHRRQKKLDHFHRHDQAYFQDSKLPGSDAVRTGHFGFLSSQEICKIIRLFTGHCRNLLAALIGWSNPVCRVIVTAPTIQSSCIIHSHEGRKRPLYEVVRYPSQVVFKWRMDAQVKGEDISGPRMDGSFQL